MIIDCRSIAQDIKDKIKNIIAEDDYAPILHIYQVGGQSCIQRLYSRQAA